MKVAIIGAGASGLAAARHVSAEDFQCEVLEMRSDLGGTWIYTKDIGKDQHGFPIYGAMYNNLRTNLPKEVMSYPDFPIINEERSYLTQPEVLKFLNLYADHFKLRHLIKFNRMVTEVLPLEENKWQVQSIDKQTKEKFTSVYDAVMVCNGHHNEPFVPKIPGEEKFNGKILHSHQYRVPDPFANLEVLVIGAGHSGFDIVCITATVAKHLVFSHHNKGLANNKFPANVTVKPDVLRIIDGEVVEFNDNSSGRFDAIIYCTGYKNSYPFLHKKCGVVVDDNHVQPLYKHVIHIDRPSMAFIGLPFFTCVIPLFDLQARFFCKYLKGSFELPSPEEMRKDTEKDMQSRWSKGLSKKKAHYLGPDQQNYFDSLAAIANIETLPPVYAKIWSDTQTRLLGDFLKFRDDKYKIIDNENFVRLL